MGVHLHVHVNRDQNLFYETLAVIIAKLFGELYRLLSLSCCAHPLLAEVSPILTCRFQLNENVKMLCLYCMIQKVQISA